MMKKNEPLIKTERMLIQPMSDEEIEELIESSESDELGAAYGQMLSGCRDNPENRIWYAPWKMVLKSDRTYIGSIGFKGPANERTVEIGYGVLPEHEGKGYTGEAVKAVTQWAFGSSEVVFVEAETESENKASQRVLEKCGFAYNGDGKEGPRFVLESPLTGWMTIYMLFGLSIGTAIGSAFNKTGIGISIGMCLGLCIGTALDLSSKKEREKLREQRKKHE